MTVFEELKARGLIAQTTNEEQIKQALENGKCTFYIGFDPTADSLHVGHFLQLVIMRRMQQAGHRPIAVLGGGTAMVGDPTGKTDMRKMMTVETIKHNADCFQRQMAKFLDFSDGNAIILNNADWLLGLNYIDFLREIGKHFSVNRMLSAECFKSRLEKGLSFIEFNYMLMQGYDFLKLYEERSCIMQLGGDDQWSNILGGVDLVRRIHAKEVYGMTFTLLTTSEGKKMGKTEKGAIWLDPAKTSPYDFYQYWRNIDDGDTVNCLKLLTFVPMDEIAEYEKLKGSGLNAAKERLAFEVTAMVHSKDQAEQAMQASKALFSTGGDLSSMPSFEMKAAQIPREGLNVLELLVLSRLAPSKSEARRLVEQGGVCMVHGNELSKVESPAYMVQLSDFTDGKMILKKGKKTFMNICLA